MMQHHLLDVQFLQETGMNVADNDTTQIEEYIIIEHRLPRKRFRRGNVGLAIILFKRCRAAFRRDGSDKQAYGERMLAARLMFRDKEGKKVKFYLVNAYQPSDNGTAEGAKSLDDYYEDLRVCLKARKKDEILIIATDANAPLGCRGMSEALGEQLTGAHGNAHRNDAGIQLREFCNAQASRAPTTFFTKGEHMRRNRAHQLRMCFQQHLEAHAQCPRVPD